MVKAESSEGVPDRTTPKEAGPVGALAVSTSVLVVSVLPVFLVGAMAVFMRDELRFGARALGLAVGSYFLASAVMSIPGGRIADWIGAQAALMTGAATSSLVLLGIAVWVQEWGHLVALLVLAGIINGVSQPATNLAISRAVPSSWQGFAFGIKQSGVPLATLIGGVSVPVLAITVGWRWAFAIASGCAALTLVYLRLRPLGSASKTGGKETRMMFGPLAVLGLAGGMANAAGSSLAAFLVSSAVDGGWDAGSAGLLLTVGSLTGILGRLSFGWWGDRLESGRFQVVAGMLLVGAAGYLAIAKGDPTFLVWIGAALGFGAGWGWHSLLLFAVVEINRGAPGAATGVILSGSAFGAAVGPAVFGAIVEVSSFEKAWLAAALITVMAACLILTGSRMLGIRMNSVRDQTG